MPRGRVFFWRRQTSKQGKSGRDGRGRKWENRKEGRQKDRKLFQKERATGKNWQRRNRDSKGWLNISLSSFPLNEETKTWLETTLVYCWKYFVLLMPVSFPKLPFFSNFFLFALFRCKSALRNLVRNLSLCRISAVFPVILWGIWIFN